MPQAPNLTACNPPTAISAPQATSNLTLAPSTDLVRLDLACGIRPKAGFKGVDLFADGCEKVDLCKFPWPWADSSIDELHASHFLEHVPARCVETTDWDPAHALRHGVMRATLIGRDMLCALMDEAWRVLKHRGTFEIVVPNARCNRAFQDPTHRRFFVAETFHYFHKPWREAQGLDHYLGTCNFEFQCNPIVPVEMTALCPEAQQRRFSESWNVVLDWQARLVAIKE